MTMNITVQQQAPASDIRVEFLTKEQCANMHNTNTQTNSTASTANLQANTKEAIINIIKEAIANKDFEGENGKTFLITNYNDKEKRLLLYGIGEEKEAELERLRRAGAGAIKTAKAMKVNAVTFNTPTLKNKTTEEIAKALTEGAKLGAYSWNKYKTEEKEKNHEPKTLTIIAPTNVSTTINETITICESAIYVRNWVNENTYSKSTELLALEAEKIAKEHNLKIKILDKRKLEEEKLGLILAVGQGSTTEPKLVIIEYKGAPANKETIAIIGKGVTFDTGGINLKPSGSIETMKEDMAGAATAYGIVQAVAKLKLPINLIIATPLVENMIGPNAFKPGNIYKAYNGKNIEISNTDAEGRLILADTIAYIEKNYAPNTIIDFATLTGSIMITFGELVAGLFSNNDELAKELFIAGEKTGERCWQLPVYQEYKDEMKSETADLKTLGYKEGKYGGAITAAAFLNAFTDKSKWAHFDIAGTAWNEQPRGYTGKAGTGWGIRLIIEWLNKKIQK